MTMGRSKISKDTSTNSSQIQSSGAKTNFASYLPAVYNGMSNRIDRYRQYDQMDQDPEIRTALNIIADFCTQSTKDYGLPFQIQYKDTMGDTEVTTLEDRLESWSDQNQFKTRIYDIIRGILKYGDQFFVRDPETFEWYWVNPTNIDKVVVNESTGKNPVIYYIRDISLNIRDKVMSNLQLGFDKMAYPGSLPNTLSSSGTQYGSVGNSGGSGADSSNQFGTNGQLDVLPVAAEHVIHLSLNTGQDPFWPFGTSILENIFKVYKQKELLEDSIIIYRVQRAPERRVFKIDVGDMQPHQAMAFVERVKNDIHQRRIPSNKGGSTSLMDAAYNPLCLDMNTKIPLLDGRTLTIWELHEEYKQGKENWVYSCHPETGAIVPGNITWAGVTKEKSKVIKITLDNGEHLICTEDHKIPVLGHGFKEAKDLTVLDSLISFSTKNEELDSSSSLSSSSSGTYQMIYDHSINDWQYTHRMVSGYFKEINKHQEFTYFNENINKSKNVVHHKDFDIYNNDPRNLQWMNKDDHFKYHSDHSSSTLENLSDEELQRISCKISKSLEKCHLNLEDLIKVRDDISGKIEKSLYCDGIVYTREMLGRIVEIVKHNNSNMLETITLCDNDQILMDLFNESNPKKHTGIDNIDRSKWGYEKLDNIIRYFGFNGWKDFVFNMKEYNHKIVKIEYLEEEITVGTITVDGNERWHNYHTFAIDGGIFVKNSILEDYFFPQTAEGRGSSVETLPGGDNLGQIDDLRYFNNKLIRGLQIPASYLPMGPDDGGVALFGDGATQAMASELRFNNECMRYQRIISRIFDDEFKRYMIKNGYNISASSFEVTFNPPMNFAANRKAEMDAKLIQTYMPLNDLKYFSKQFIMKKMGFEQDDIVENERLWIQENPESVQNNSQDVADTNAGLQSVGLEAPNNPESDLGMDDNGNLESADAEYQEQTSGDGGFDPSSLGNSF